MAGLALVGGAALATAAPVIAGGVLLGAVKGGIGWGIIGGIIGAFTKSKDQEVAEALSSRQGRGHVHVHEHCGPVVETTRYRDMVAQQPRECDRVR